MSRFYSRFNQEDEVWEVCDAEGGIVCLAASGEAAQAQADKLNLTPEGMDEYPNETPEQDFGSSPGY